VTIIIRKGKLRTRRFARQAGVFAKLWTRRFLRSTMNRYKQRCRRIRGRVGSSLGVPEINDSHDFFSSVEKLMKRTLSSALIPGFLLCAAVCLVGCGGESYSTSSTRTETVTTPGGTTKTSTQSKTIMTPDGKSTTNTQTEVKSTGDNPPPNSAGKTGR
jgi:hypothetical protein